MKPGGKRGGEAEGERASLTLEHSGAALGLSAPRSFRLHELPSDPSPLWLCPFAKDTPKYGLWSVSYGGGGSFPGKLPHTP